MSEDHIGLISVLVVVLVAYALALVATWLDQWFKGPWSTP